jgi:hypothetical protein
VHIDQNKSQNKFKQAFENLFSCFLVMENDQTLRAIHYQRGSLSILDQLKLPDQSIYISIQTVDDAWKAIHTMSIRGINE